MQRLVLVSTVLVVTGIGAVALGRDAELSAVSRDVINDAGRTVSLLANQLPDAIERAFNRAPVAVLAFAFGGLLPVIGFVVWLVRAVGRVVSRLGRWLGSPSAGPAAQDITATLAGPGAVWLDVGRDRPRRVALNGEMHRIGSDPDCDIQIPGSAATGSQALIRRTPEREYHLIDISGRRDPSVRINGAEAWTAKLRDGDAICVGEMQAVFRHERLPNATTWASQPATVRTAPPR